MKLKLELLLNGWVFTRFIHTIRRKVVRKYSGKNYKSQSSENLSKLNIFDVVFVYHNFVKNDYQSKSKIF